MKPRPCRATSPQRSPGPTPSARSRLACTSKIPTSSPALTHADAALDRRRSSSAGCSGVCARLLADPVDDRHGSPRAASSRIRAPHRRGRDLPRARCRHRRPARRRSPPPRRSPARCRPRAARRAPRGVADRQRPAMPEPRMGTAHQRSQRDRTRPRRVLELRAPVVVPELDRPGRDGDLVRARATRRARRRARARPSRPDAASRARRSGAARRRSGCAANAGRVRAQEIGDGNARSPAPAARARRAARDRAARRRRPRAAARSASRRPRPRAAPGRTSTDSQPSGSSLRAHRARDREAEPEAGKAAQLRSVDAAHPEDQRRQLELVGARRGDARPLPASRGWRRRWHPPARSP